MAKGMIIEPRYFWNLDSNVGPGCPNKIEDVQLVQLGYACKAMNPKVPPSPEERATYGKVVPGAPYFGSPDDPLSVAIKFHQSRRTGTKDGIVSSMKNSTGSYGPDMVWIIGALNNNIADVMGADWPRLEKHPQCPSALKAASLRVLGGPAT